MAAASFFAQHSTAAARGGVPGDVAQWTLAQASAAIHARTVSPVALTEACLQRIDRYESHLNAFILILREQALGQARTLEAEQKAGRFRGPLHGIPVAVKDNMDIAGVRTSAGSAVLDDRIASSDSEVVRRLKDAGAVILGKTNMDEFAMGPPYFGPVHNPWALDRETGGSSSGSAVAVASGLCYAALGTDTSCSIRMPASYCGVVGLKPTYGLVSIRGIVPLVVSLDHCGPLTRSVEDAALMLQTLAGYDRLDIASTQHNAEDYAAAMQQSVSSLRIGIARQPFFDKLDPAVGSAMEAAIAVIGKLTRQTIDVSLPPTNGYGFELYSEASAYQENYLKKDAGRYMDGTREELEKGWNRDQNDYIRATWDLALLRRTIDDAFSNFDLVILPTMRDLPGQIDAPAAPKAHATGPRENPFEWMDCVENNEAFNVYGIPAISVPCGFSDAGLPIGMMIAGPRFSEGRILALASAYERATDWHNRHPELKAV
jgi:aspartyl-tRNA(Asn)/glutamyl-tRNA(Gln) amidotransferase subunit A